MAMTYLFIKENTQDNKNSTVTAAEIVTSRRTFGRNQGIIILCIYSIYLFIDDLFISIFLSFCSCFLDFEKERTL